MNKNEVNARTLGTVERERERESYTLLDEKKFVKNVLVNAQEKLYILYRKLRIDMIKIKLKNIKHYFSYQFFYKGRKYYGKNS